MKKFSFRITKVIAVYTDSEEEAKTIFCDDPGAWDFDEEDMVLVAVQDFDVSILPPGSE